MGIEEVPAELRVDEQVVLSKFDGDPSPENEVERITIHNGEVVSHDVIEAGEVVGPVENSELLGTDMGRLIPTENEGGTD